MKSILIVCSTRAEAKGLISPSSEGEIMILNSEIDLLISGIGIQKTTFSLTKALLQKEYDFVVNVGLAGTYDESLELGSIINITEECFADLGVITNKNIHSVFSLGLENANDFPFVDGIIKNRSEIPKDFNDYITVRGATVNSLLTDEIGNNLRRTQLGVSVETMEGAAVFYTCSMLGKPFIQLRAISNRVGQRDKTKWMIQPAIEKLNKIIKSIYNL